MVVSLLLLSVLRLGVVISPGGELLAVLVVVAALVLVGAAVHLREEEEMVP